jgi:hypothetical protein
MGDPPMGDPPMGVPSPLRTIVPPAPLVDRTRSSGMVGTPDGQRFVFFVWAHEAPGLTLMQGLWKLLARN